MCVAVVLIGRYVTGHSVLVLIAQVICGAVLYGLSLLLLRDSMLHELFMMGTGFLRKQKNRQNDR